jgi:hypothetical protein
MPRCGDCGFLALRDAQTRELVETEAGMRKSWHLPVLPDMVPKYENAPLCFAMAADLKAESEGPGGTFPIDGILLIERNCGKFTPWVQGFTPREHREMIESQESKERDRQWQAEQKALEHQFQKDQAFWNRIFALIAVFTAALLSFIFASLK